MQPGEQLGKGPGVPSARPHAAPCTRSLIQGRVWLCSGFYFWIFFSPQGPCLYLQPLGGRRAGGSPDSNRLRVNVRDPWGRSSLGDCWAVRGRPEETSVLSGGRGALEGYNSLEEIWPFLLLLRWAGPLLQSVHPWDSSLRKIHRCTELQVQGFTAAKSKSVQRATIRELCE